MKSKNALYGLLTGVVGLIVLAAPALSDGSDIDIPYTKYVLDNGLTLIVHEDRKAPVVAVNVWYHVGSKNEKLGKTGFAHLFEHLMFNGTENYDDDYFKPFDRVGATDMNGTTNEDRTNYFQNVPNTALDVALWMESDRMGHLLGAVTQEKLDEQRGVVKNEKRQRENQPYGKVFDYIQEAVYPQGHPYSWTTIGSMEDLDAASLDDVREWFKTYYGPNNAVIVVAGDIDAETAKQRVEAYFGDIPPGPPLARHDTWVAKRSGTHRQILEDRVPQARVYKVWNTPEWGSPEADQLKLASAVLASDKNSRLYKRLVYQDQIATDVGSMAYTAEIGGAFLVWATAQPGTDLSAVEAAMDEEIARFLREGPQKKELARVKTQQRSGFIRGVERIGGFGGKSDILAKNEVFAGDPDYYKVSQGRIKMATPASVRDAAREWLSDGVYVLEVHPFEERTAAESGVNRSKLPEPDQWPDVRFPEFEKTTLSNGLNVIIANRPAVPVVNFSLMVDAGYSADQMGVPGTASLAMNMMDEGTGGRSALEISEELALLGANLGASANLDTSVVSLSALKENLDDSLEVYADVILNPAFPEKEFERLQKQQLASIQREKVTPVSMALRVFPRLLYGEDHAYGLPFTGSGTEESVQGLSTAELQAYHQAWFKPNNATMIVVGDTTAEEIAPKLERLFADWEAGETPEKNVAEVSHREEATVYLMDRPGSEQSIIFAAHIAPPKANPNEIAIESMNDVLGGTFSSRINMNLREDKHWSYGASSLLVNAQGQRPFIVYAPVQGDRTKESMLEIQKELEAVVGERPPTEQEVAKIKDKNTLSLPGRWETGSAVAGSIAEIVRFGLPDDHWDTYSSKVRELEVADVADVAKNVIFPDKLVWVVVGDRKQIEPGIRELGLGAISLIDADGQLLSESDKVAESSQ